MSVCGTCERSLFSLLLKERSKVKDSSHWTTGRSKARAKEKIMKKKRREVGIENKGRKWETDSTHSRRINLWLMYRTKSPCQAPCVTTVTSSLIIAVNTSAKQGKHWANTGREDHRKSCELCCWLAVSTKWAKGVPTFLVQKPNKGPYFEEVRATMNTCWQDFCLALICTPKSPVRG